MEAKCLSLLKGCGLEGLITMKKKDFIKEHKNLLRILKEGNPKELKKEYAEQKAELKKYKLKGGMLTQKQLVKYKDRLEEELEEGKHEEDAWDLIDELLPKLRKTFPEDGDLMMGELDELRAKAPEAQKRTLARHTLGALMRVIEKHSSS